MKTGILIAVAVLVLGGAGWLFVSGQTAQKEMMMHKDEATKQAEAAAQSKSDAMMHMDVASTAMMKDDGMMKKDEGATMKDEGTMMAKGTYEVYAPAKLAMADHGKVVLFFRATWCPTCRALDADIRAHLGSVPAGVTILDVDYDTSAVLKQKYGVTYQHTMVQVDSAGKEITKWSGSPTLAEFVTHIK